MNDHQRLAVADMVSGIIHLRSQGMTDGEIIGSINEHAQRVGTAPLVLMGADTDKAQLAQTIAMLTDLVLALEVTASLAGLKEQVRVALKAAGWAFIHLGDGHQGEGMRTVVDRVIVRHNAHATKAAEEPDDDEINPQHRFGHGRGDR